jgi:hypothetical protein
MKPRRTSTVTPRQQRQREQWRTRKAAQLERERYRNPATHRKDAKRHYGQYLLDSQARILTDPILAAMTAEHGRDDDPLPRREYKKLVEHELAGRINLLFKITSSDTGKRLFGELLQRLGLK